MVALDLQLLCHRSDPHASVTARGFVSPSARATIRTLRDMVPHSPSRSHFYQHLFQI